MKPGRETPGERAAFAACGLGAALQEVFLSAASHAAVTGSRESLTYTDLANRSAALAVRLADAGVTPGEIVPLVLPRSIDMVVAMVAAVRLGATYAPIDPAAPPVRVQGILAALGARVGVAAAVPAPGTPLDGTQWLKPAQAGAAPPAAPPWHRGAWHDPLYLMFTSGSTGVPKGVLVPASGVPLLVSEAVGAIPMGQARWSHASSPAFDISNLEIWGALLTGSCLVVQDHPQPSLDDLARFFSDHGITHGQLSTGIFNAMVEDCLPSFAGLQQMIVGGERASPTHMRAFLLAHPHVRLVNGYGPTETTIYSLMHTVGLDDTHAAGGIPIGRLVQGTSCKLVPLAAGDRLGELWLSGAALAQGYFKSPALTAERFIEEGGARWYRTGDLALRRDDGVFEYHGRADRQVKVQGVRIELDEVELALSAFPGIDQVATFLRGESAECNHLVGWYTAHAGAVDEPALRAFLAQRLPAAAVPRHLLWRADMPTNLNGKVDRAMLERLYDDSIADPVATPCFTEALRLALERTPNAVALEGVQGSFTGAQLNAQSARVAAHLQRLGVQVADTVALLLPRSPALVAAMVGVLRRGAVYAPLSPSGASGYLQSTLGVLAPAVCVVTSLTDVQALRLAPTCRIVTIAELLTAAPGERAGDPAGDWTHREPLATACVMFTSGSTGVPKGVCVPLAGLLRLVRGGDHVAFAPGQRWAFWSSPAFDASHLEIWAPLLNGGTCVVCEDEHPSLDDLADFVQHRRISDAWLTSGLFNAMVDTQLPALRHLSQLLVGGERVSPRHVAAFLRQAAPVALINGYGPTENTTFTTCHRIRAQDMDEPAGIPIGRAIQGTVLHIEPVADDRAAGELWVAGDGVANGYLNAEAATADRFVSRDGRRWYRTGDLVQRRVDGVLLYHGRTDRQVKLQGHRIELDAVEHALAACAGVSEAIVAVAGDEAHDRYLVSAYSLAEGAAATPEQLIASLQQRLPSHAVPRVLQPMDTLPRTVNGKVDRDAVLRHLLVPAGVCPQAEHTVPVASDVDDAPLRQMVALWRRFLPTASADPRASFTQLGGTSVLALLLATAIRRELNRRVSPVELLRRPLLQDHVDLVARTAPEAAPHAAAPAPGASDEGWLTEAQAGLLSAAQLDDDTGSMLLHVAVCLPPAVAPGQLQEAFTTVVQRHPMLRLSAQHLGDRVQTRLLDALPRGWWTEHDAVLDGFPADLAWPSDLLALVQRPLDLLHEGPMRVDLWPVRSGGHLMVWTVHHFAADEIGIDNALHELDTLLKGGPLAPVYGSPFAFSAVERSAIDHAGIKYRAQALARDLGRLRLPFEHRGQPAREHLHTLPAAHAQALQDAMARWRCTPFVPVLTAYGLALQEVFGPAARHVLTPFSRRSEPQLLEPITYFLDLRFIEAGGHPEEGVAAHLRRVQCETLQAHQLAFQPVPRVAQALAALDADAAQRTTAFAFTWREAPARTLSMGDSQARLIRAPQRGARFGVALHAARVDGAYSFAIEAAEAAHRDGWVDKVWDAFCRHLAQVCEVSCFEPHDEPAAPAPADAHPASHQHALRTVLAAAWRRWAPMTPGVPADGANFLALGGSSLAAMRLAAQVKREVGATLDLAVFLRRPTFANLCAQCEQDAKADTALPTIEPPPTPCRQIADLVWVGDAQAPKAVLVIPGDGGHAVGLLQVATELQRTLGPGVAIGLVELANIVERSHSATVGDTVSQRVTDIARLIGPHRLLAVVGYSLGGLLALQVAHTLQLPREVGVSLLDTYAPLRRDGTPVRFIEGKLARLVMWLRGWRPEQFQLVEVDPAAVAQHDSRGSSLWRDLIRQLHARRSFPARGTSVLVIQAERSQFSTGLLWRRATNGFRARDYHRLTVYRVPIGHLDLPRQSACAVAHLIAAQIQLIQP